MPYYFRMDVLYVINKADYSTTVYKQYIDYPSAVLLAPGSPGVFYASSKTKLLRLHAGKVEP